MADRDEQTAQRGERGGSGFMDWVRKNRAQQPKLGAEVRSWLREGAKDFWNAFVPAFPDSQRLGDELGTPLNPTPQNVTSDLGNFHGYRQDRDVSGDASHRAQFQNQHRDQDLSR